MSLVIDASVTLAWVLAEETTTAALPVRARVIAEGAIAPQHWRLEVCNALLIAARRRRYDLEFLVDDLGLLGELPILIDGETSAVCWGDTRALAQAHGLTMYDAAYLELALRLGLPLATCDHALAAAARAASATIA